MIIYVVSLAFQQSTGIYNRWILELRNYAK